MHIEPGFARRAASLAGAAIALWATAAIVWWFVFDDSTDTSRSAFTLPNILLFNGAATGGVIMSFLLGAGVLLISSMAVEIIIDGWHWLFTGRVRGATKVDPEPAPAYTHCNNSKCGCGYHQKPTFHQDLREWVAICRFDDCTCGHHKGQVFDYNNGWWVMGEGDLRFAGMVVYPSINNI